MYKRQLVANAFAALPKQEQSILILFCVLELGDGEIGDLMGMSRSAVQRHLSLIHISLACGMAASMAIFSFAFQLVPLRCASHSA